MCVCVCVCVCVCEYICTRVSVNVFIFVILRECVFVCLRDFCYISASTFPGGGVFFLISCLA